jgi:hypothetical protein
LVLLLRTMSRRIQGPIIGPGATGQIVRDLNRTYPVLMTAFLTELDHAFGGQL